MELANVAFNAPETLHRDESAEIQLLLSLEKSVGELRAELQEVGERIGARVYVSPSVEARLTGSGFRIEALTPERQPVGLKNVTEWRWDVEATEGGTRTLHLTLSALVVVNGERTLRTIQVFDQRVLVRVTLVERVTGFVGNNWQWLWAFILLPVGGFVVRWWRRRGARSAQEPGS